MQAGSQGRQSPLGTAALSAPPDPDTVFRTTPSAATAASQASQPIAMTGCDGRSTYPMLGPHPHPPDRIGHPQEPAALPQAAKLRNINITLPDVNMTACVCMLGIYAGQQDIVLKATLPPGNIRPPTAILAAPFAPLPPVWHRHKSIHPKPFDTATIRHHSRPLAAFLAWHLLYSHAYRAGCAVAVWNCTVTREAQVREESTQLRPFNSGRLGPL